MLFGTLSSVASGGSLPFGMAQPAASSWSVAVCIEFPFAIVCLVVELCCFSVRCACAFFQCEPRFVLVCDTCACASGMVKARQLVPVLGARPSFGGRNRCRGR
ncbi:hypothetical protein ACJRO7_018626 [Eucalyptus globulus]|uniref:Secreted protein n=1 Tax=Eucalyptus globulus TaxID=34317 RepID=A0ABD3KVI9_EUCGL